MDLTIAVAGCKSKTVEVKLAVILKANEHGFSSSLQ